MTIDMLRLICDAAFLVLIWAVQLVIYPSFKFYTAKNLFRWHQSYTKHVTIIVLPLMFSQLVLSLMHLYQFQNLYTIIISVIVLSLWALTFLIFVPLHQSIDNNKPVENVCNKLVSKNWIRTLLWTLLFIITLLNYVSLNS